MPVTRRLCPVLLATACLVVLGHAPARAQVLSEAPVTKAVEALKDIVVPTPPTQAVAPAATAMPAAPQGDVLDRLDADLSGFDLLPRGPDLEALRFYAKNGEHDRYRREYQRLRTLYPTWQPPKDLFATQADEQDVWDVYGENDLGSLEDAIRKRKAENPDWQPSPILAEKIEQRRIRAGLAAKVKAGDWTGILVEIEKMPSMLDGQDVELLWFVAQAFGETGRKDDALAAFRAALAVARNGSEKGATLQKAAPYLDAETLANFVKDVTASITEIDDIEAIEDGFVSGVLEATLKSGTIWPAAYDDKLQAFIDRAVQSGNQEHIQLLAWAAFAAEDWEGAHAWFERMPDENQDPKVLEGKVLSLKHKGDWLTAFQKARGWRDVSEGMGKLYINLGAPYMLPQRPEKFDAAFLSEYAAKTLELNRGEGAEALGWYAYNIRQLRTAHEWFLKAAQWEETDTSAYGLVLTARAARDLDLFTEYKRLYGPIYPLVARTEFTPCGNDTPIETIYYESEEYKEWRARIEAQIAERQGYSDEMRCADDIESRRVNEQRFVERVEGVDRPIAPWEVDRTERRFYDGAAAPVRRAEPVRTVSQERTAAVSPRRVSPQTTGSTGGGSGAAGALSRKDYVSCLRITDQAVRSGRASAKDWEVRGWCLLGANRPTEAEQSFARSKAMGGGGNSAYGETLAQLRNGKTNDAHVVASNAPMSAANRRDIDIAVLTQRAQAAYQQRDYQSVLYALDERRKRTAEPRDLMMLRGWALYHLGFRREAHNIMRAIDAQMSTKDSRQAVAATGRLGG